MESKKKLIFLFFIVITLFLFSKNVEAWWNNSCLQRTIVNVTNNHPYYDMIEHETNITINTTGPNWESQKGGIYVIENDNVVRTWWNETPFDFDYTQIWVRLNISQGQTKGIEFYYNCSGATQVYNKSDVYTIWDDFDFLNTDEWGNASSLTNPLKGELNIIDGALNITVIDDAARNFGINSTHLFISNYSYRFRYEFQRVDTQNTVSAWMFVDDGLQYVTTNIKNGFYHLNNFQGDHILTNYAYDNGNLEVNHEQGNVFNNVGTFYNVTDTWNLTFWNTTIIENNGAIRGYGTDITLSGMNDTSEWEVKLNVYGADGSNTNVLIRWIEMLKIFESSQQPSFVSNDEENRPIYNVSVILYEPTGTKTSRSGLPLKFYADSQSGTLNKCYYNVTLSTGGSALLSNSSLACDVNTTFDMSQDGDFILYFFAEDDVGEINNSETIDFSIDTTGVTPGPPSGGGGKVVTFIIGNLTTDVEFSLMYVTFTVPYTPSSKDKTIKMENVGEVALENMGLEVSTSLQPYIQATVCEVDLSNCVEDDFDIKMGETRLLYLQGNFDESLGNGVEGAVSLSTEDSVFPLPVVIERGPLYSVTKFLSELFTISEFYGLLLVICVGGIIIIGLILWGWGWYRFV